MQVPWAMPYINGEELNEIIETVKSGWLSMGPRVERFEQIISEFIGVKHCIAVNSGTAALDIALKVLDIQPGDEVIVPAFTYIATANSVLYQHAVPVFADVDPRTYTLDSNDVIRKITSKTKCLLPVDYAGQAADFDALREIAIKHHLHIVEDGAPGFGGEYKGRKLCSLGDVSIASFHMAKIFTTVEGGMVFTNDDELAKLARMIRSQGEDPNRKYYHPILGHNYRMSDLHAAVGLAQMKRIKEILSKRAELSLYYTEHLKDCSGIIIPHVAEGNKHAWFLYPILVNNRDVVKNYLSEKGISINVSWPLPVYEQEFYKQLKTEPCRVTEDITKKILCLPLYYTMKQDEQDYVIDCLKRAVEVSVSRLGLEVE